MLEFTVGVGRKSPWLFRTGRGPQQGVLSPRGPQLPVVMKVQLAITINNCSSTPHDSGSWKVSLRSSSKMCLP